MRVEDETFSDHREAQDLLPRIHDALQSLCGRATKESYSVPRKLKQLSRPTRRGEPGRLLPNYVGIWKGCSIVFDPKERGASIRMPTGRISFGPFFVSGWKRRDLEKVILHEYLHKAVAMQPSFGGDSFRKGAQHGEIDQIIQFELRYPDHPRGNRQLD
jgi:hypothetical protein